MAGGVLGAAIYISIGQWRSRRQGAKLLKYLDEQKKPTDEEKQ